MRLFSYLPVIMAQAKIQWDRGDYAAVENLFGRSSEFCKENEMKVFTNIDGWLEFAKLDFFSSFFDLNSKHFF